MFRTTAAIVIKERGKDQAHAPENCAAVGANRSEA